MQPTFAGWRDRATFIVTERPILAFLALLAVVGAVVAFVVWGPTIVIPAWGWSLLGGFLILAPVLTPLGVAFGRWLRRRNAVTVYLCNAENHARQDGKAQEKFYVPPEKWRGKDVGQHPPTPINGGAAWQVREFTYDEDTETLFVEGTPLPALNDDRMMTWKTYVEDVYGNLLDRHHRLNRARDRMSKMAVDVEEATINESAEARERGQMLDKTATKETWEDATRDMDEISDADDLPDISDYMNYEESEHEAEPEDSVDE